MQHTTRSSALGGIMAGSGIRTDSTPGSAESMPAGIASGVAATDATTIWIEQLRRLPHLTPIARSMSETPSNAHSARSMPTSASRWSFATTAISPWSRLLGRLGRQ